MPSNDAVNQALAQAFERMIGNLPPLEQLLGSPTGRTAPRPLTLDHGLPRGGGQLTELRGREPFPRVNYGYYASRILRSLQEQQVRRVRGYLSPRSPGPKYITPAILPAARPVWPTLWEHLDDAV